MPIRPNSAWALAHHDIQLSGSWKDWECAYRQKVLFLGATPAQPILTTWTQGRCDTTLIFEILAAVIKQCVSYTSRIACRSHAQGTGLGTHRCGSEASLGAAEGRAVDGRGARLGCEDGDGRLGRQRARLGVLRDAGRASQLRRSQRLPGSSCLAGNNLHSGISIRDAWYSRESWKLWDQGSWSDLLKVFDCHFHLSGDLWRATCRRCTAQQEETLRALHSGWHTMSTLTMC